MSTDTNGEKKQIMLDFGSGGNPFNAVTVNSTSPDEASEEIIDTPITPDTPVDVIDDDPIDDVVESEVDEPDDVDTPDNGIVTDDDADIDDVDNEDDNLNLYYHLGAELKEDAFLPDDFELTEDVDGSVLKQAVKERLRAEVEPAIKQEYDQYLSTQGYVEEDLIISRALRQGVDPRLLSAASMYELYSNASDDADLATKESIITQMYRSRNFEEDEIQNLIKISKGNDEDGVSPEFDKKFNDAREFFHGKYQTFVQEQEELNANIQKQAQENLRRSNELINNIIRNRDIMGVTMTPTQAKEFENAVKKPEIIEIGDQKYQATELHKFLYDFQTNDEIKLLSFFLHKFRDETKDQLKKQAKKEVESEFMQSYKQRAVKKQAASKNKRKIKEQLDAQKRKGQSTFLDFSQQR